MLGFVPKHFFEYWVLQSAKKVGNKIFHFYFAVASKGKTGLGRWQARSGFPKEPSGQKRFELNNPNPPQSPTSLFGVRYASPPATPAGRYGLVVTLFWN